MTTHAAGTASLALCGDETAGPEDIVSDSDATCWECQSIIRLTTGI